jgi:hypothetical protein
MRDVAYWPKADMLFAPTDVCLWVVSRHLASDKSLYRNQNDFELGIRTGGGALSFSSTPDAR